MTTELSKLASEFLAKKPTLIGVVLGVRFYEHPTLGDEAPLVAICEDGKKRRTDFWDVPDFDEVCEWRGWEIAKVGAGA